MRDHLDHRESIELAALRQGWRCEHGDVGRRRRRAQHVSQCIECCCAVLVSMRQDHNLATFRCWPTCFAWIGKEGYGGLGSHPDELFYSLQKIHDIFSQMRNALHYDSASATLNARR